MNNPLISVITVLYNSAPTLEATFKSVLSQDSSLFEYWIIDGCSTDGSVDIVRKYEDRLSGWVSERDKGIFDAMNKGIDLTKGEWLYFLGADDTLQPDVLSQISIYLAQPYKIVFGDVVFSNNHVMRSYLGPRTLMLNTLHHQGAFYHRSLFDSFRYDSSLQTQADYELNISVYIRRLPIVHVPLVISTFAIGGKSAGATEMSYNEINHIRARHLTDKWQNISLKILLRLYYWQKQFRFWLYGHHI